MITTSINLKSIVNEQDINRMLYHRLARLIYRKDVKLGVQSIFYKMCSPYVPFDTGMLDQSVRITPQYVAYTQPYAHYQYEGIIYGPNIPFFDKNGKIIKWRSPKDKPKHPTGRFIKYDTHGHPLATRHWDEAMLKNRGDEFTEEVRKLLIAKWEEKYG